MLSPLHPHSLIDNRLQLHYAVQLLASAAALVTPEADFSHTALEWNLATLCFQTKLIPASRSIRVALEPVSLMASITDATGDALSVFPLCDRTLVDGYSWLRESLNVWGGKGELAIPLAYPTYDFPFHPLALGQRFNSDGEVERKALATYYHRSAALFEHLRSDCPEASAVRVWPHHFDIALLMLYSEDKSIGVGLSPGDRSYGQPYWYVSPWPYPTLLPELPLGRWHTEEWTGAVLTATELGEGADQVIEAFLHDAIATSRLALGLE